MTRLTAGTRGSDLARAQTDWVCGQLTALYPELRISLSIIKTGGDMHADRPLSAWDGSGVFTRELEEALLAKQIDFAVHSLKDLPTEQPPGLIVAAIPQRGPVEDVLFTHGRYTLATLPAGARVGTSSPRRRIQLLAARPDLRIEELRGNVPTRIQRVCDGDLDAVVLARAGLARLGLEKDIIAYTLSPETMLPAPGQGALAIEIRTEDRDLAQWLRALHDPTTAEMVGCERALLKAFRGGCHAPIAVLARPGKGDRLCISAFAASEDGLQTAWISRYPSLEAAEEESLRIGIQLRHQLRKSSEMPPAVSGASLEKCLSGVRIVITRAPEQSETLRRLLEHAGAAVRLFPTIKIAPGPRSDLAEESPVYDWILFTSANAVCHWIQSPYAKLLAATSTGMPKTAIIGPATYQVAKRWGINAVLPLAATAEGMFKMLQTAAHPLSGKRFLLPRGNKARPWLTEQLREAGAIVDDPVVYQTLYHMPSDMEKFFLNEFMPNVVVFMSPSAVEGFQRAWPAEGGNVWYSIMAAVAIGPSTAEAARNAGFLRVFESPEQSEPGIARFLITLLPEISAQKRGSNA